MKFTLSTVAVLAVLLVFPQSGLTDQYQKTRPNAEAACRGLLPDALEIFKAYSGRNAILSKVEFTESVFDQPFRGTLDVLVGAQRFLTPSIWWQSPKTRDEGRIWARDSKSPLGELFGEDAYRKLFWPTRNYTADLDTVRIAVNYGRTGASFQERRDWSPDNYSPLKGYEPLGLEMMVRISDKWEPFYFIRVDHTPPGGLFRIRSLHDGAGGPPSLIKDVSSAWLPVHTFRNQPIEIACAKCHGFPLSPRPSFYKTPDDYLSAGFSEPRIIDRLLTY